MPIKKIVLVLFLLSNIMYGSNRTVPLTDLGRPVGLEVDGQNLYITENARVHIYSLTDFSRIASFGAKGQGPGEFQTLPHVHITLDASTDELIVGSIRKISYYDKKGTLLRENRGKSLALKPALLDRIDNRDRFLGWSQRNDTGITFNTVVVFDQDLNAVKELYREKDPFQGPGKGYNILPKAFNYASHQGRILLPGPDEATVDILDLQFNPVGRIRVEQKPDPVGDQFKQQMIHFLKTSPETKDAYAMLEPIEFPPFFPVISDFFADDGLVYIMTWKREKGQNEFFIHDLAGKFIRRTMIPIRYETDLQPYPARIRNSVLYQLVENEASQEWELTVTDLRN